MSIHSLSPFLPVFLLLPENDPYMYNAFDVYLDV